MWDINIKYSTHGNILWPLKFIPLFSLYLQQFALNLFNLFSSPILYVSSDEIPIHHQHSRHYGVWDEYLNEASLFYVKIVSSNIPTVIFWTFFYKVINVIFVNFLQLKSQLNWFICTNSLMIMLKLWNINHAIGVLNVFHAI